MCLITDKKYTEIVEAVNSLDRKEDIIEIQNKEKDNIIADDEVCYFIAELDLIHVFKLSVRNIIKILGECSFFEYYIADLKIQKLLCETDHGDLLYL